MRKLLSVLPQYLVPQRALSLLAGWLAERRTPWFKNWQIQHLITRYGADMSSAVLTSLDDYPTFNSFFTRYLKPGLRPIASSANAIACPADGFINQAGTIVEGRLFQAKGFDFTLQELLGGSKTWTSAFSDGAFATVYLAPKNYHRVHMPFTGRLLETIFIPGKLFSVNRKTTRAVPRLFARNERLVCLFDTAVGPMAVILVGAMLVGSIHTVWDDHPLAGKITHRSYTDSNMTLERGAEMGHFTMGSTVIILFAKDKITWDASIQEDLPVMMGQLAGKIID